MIKKIKHLVGARLKKVINQLFYLKFQWWTKNLIECTICVQKEGNTLNFALLVWFQVEVFVTVTLAVLTYVSVIERVSRILLTYGFN